jgi:hypothetical protein
MPIPGWSADPEESGVKGGLWPKACWALASAAALMMIQMLICLSVLAGWG